jgi:predicted metal-dependent peptidase
MSAQTTKENSTKATQEGLEIPKFDPNRNSEEYVFDSDFIELFVHDPFLGGIFQNITRRHDWNFPTAYIYFDHINFGVVMGYNPEFMARLTSKQRQWVIKHEIYHLVLLHISDRGNTNPKFHQIFNIGIDLAVNSLLGKENMFEHAVMPGIEPKEAKDKKFAKFLGKLPELQSSNFYIDEIKKFIEKNSKCAQCEQEKQQNKEEKTNKSEKNDNGISTKENENNQLNNHEHQENGDQCDHEGHDHRKNKGDSDRNEDSETNSDFYNKPCDKHGGNNEVDYTLDIGNGSGETMDGHSLWGDIPDDIKEIMKEKLKDMIREGVNRANRSNNWGSVSAEIRERIQKMLLTEINWKDILKYFIGKTRSMERTSTIKRINKKAPYILPGVRRKTQAKLAFFVDQSGSMTTEDVQLAQSAAMECSNIVEIDVYNFDTTVDENKQVWKKGKNSEWQRTRTGGTDFGCIADFCNRPENKGKYSAIVILTDGYAAQLPQIIGAKVLWLVTPHGTMEPTRSGDLVLRMRSDKTAKRI